MLLSPRLYDFKSSIKKWISFVINTACAQVLITKEIHLLYLYKKTA